jgi:hypothetical protein
MVIFLLTFTPVPFSHASLEHFLRMNFFRP